MCHHLQRTRNARDYTRHDTYRDHHLYLYFSPCNLFFSRCNLCLHCLLSHDPQIGALFPADQIDQRAVFNYAVNRINSDTNLLLESVLSPQIETVAGNDSFRAVKSGKCCIARLLCTVDRGECRVSSEHADRQWHSLVPLSLYKCINCVFTVYAR